MAEQSVSRDVELARNRVVDKKIRSVHVYGVNSLKTLDPPLDELVGDQVVDFVAQDDVRRVELVCRNYIVAIDLARTGRLIVLSDAGTWRPGSGSPMPTGRVIFDDGTGIDLKEPAKTKRITFAVRRR
jgi:hypothetical protein